MGVRINTNIEALNAQRNLGISGLAMSKSVEKLSSGLRINRAADDAAGLAISEKLRAQVKGLNQASRNAQDGISMIQTAEGALNEVHSMLQRMRELSVQAANASLSDTDRTSVQDEMKSLVAEMDRVATSTKFNGNNLLTGALSSTNGGATGSDLVVGDTLATTQTAMVTDMQVGGAKAQTYTFTTPGAGQITLTGADGTAQTVAVNAIGANGSQTLDFSQLGVKVTLQATSAGKAAADIITDLTAAANDTIVVAAGSGSGTFQVGAEGSDTLSVSFSDARTSNLFSGGDATNLTNATTGTLTATEANTLISSIDTAIGKVSTQRGTYGAAQNRLEHTIANLGVASENLSASESRIRDLDVANEMVSFTKTQILQQAGTAILAQANQAPQNILTLLR